MTKLRPVVIGKLNHQEKLKGQKNSRKIQLKKLSNFCVIERKLFYVDYIEIVLLDLKLYNRY